MSTLSERVDFRKLAAGEIGDGTVMVRVHYKSPDMGWMVLFETQVPSDPAAYDQAVESIYDGADGPMRIEILPRAEAIRLPRAA